MANNRNLSALCDTSCISYNKDLHTLDAILGYLTNDYYATQIAVSIITRSGIIHVTDFWYPIRKSIISPTTCRFIRISALWPKTYSRRNCVKITCVVDKNTDISWIAQTSVLCIQNRHAFRPPAGILPSPLSTNPGLVTAP